MKEDGPLNPEQLENAYRIAYLIAGHIRKTLTSAETLELDNWLDESERHIELFEELTDEQNIEKAIAWYEKMRQQQSFKRLQEKIPFTPPKKRRSLRLSSFAIAATVLILLGVGVVLMLQKSEIQPSKPVSQGILAKEDITPGGTKAILTLSDGSQVILDSSRNGSLAVQGNTQVIKTDSTLSYRDGSEVGIKQEAVYNSLTIPNGGTYKLILPDGTKVWLNAASSLKYPTAFNGKSRRVELRGEGYFEVVHDPTQPFSVQVGNTEIQDLGTAFNINSYNDAGVLRATLLKGSIKVINGKNERTLKPGEEAQIDENKVVIVPADIESATAWKEGQFVFHKTPMNIVMSELERWYDIKVENKDRNHNHLNATIDRSAHLSKVLHYLEGSVEVKFSPSERKLTIIK